VFEIGNSLREARIRREIGLPEAEQGTKIRVKYLRALEDDQFDLLPAQTYVKGFLRTYAEYLGLDGQLYVDEFNSRFVAGEEESVLRPRRSPARPPRRERRAATTLVVLALAAVGIVTIVVISAWTSSGGTPKTTPAAATANAGRPARRPARPAPLLTVSAVRAGSHITVRRGSATGATAFDGTIQKGHPASIPGTRLWVQITSPENVRVLVRGHRVVVPGGQPRVGIVTRSGWQPA